MRHRLHPLALAMLTVAVGLAPGAARAEQTVTNGTVVASITPGHIQLRNGLVMRQWDPGRLVTLFVGGVGGAVESRRSDFALQLDGIVIESGAMVQRAVRAEPIPRGVRVVWDLMVPRLMAVRRTVEAYDGIGGFRAETRIEALAPVALQWYSLDQIDVAPLRAAATVHEFRAGADWRYDQGWNPPSIGDPHTGVWRVAHAGGLDEPVVANGEWMSIALEPRGRIAMVMERRNYASSVMSFRPGLAQATVDLSRDVVYLGPFEEEGHVENPLPQGPGGTDLVAQPLRAPAAGARARTVGPGRPVTLEPVFTLITTDEDREAWEFHKYLTRVRLTPYPKAVTFNTNNVDANEISTGAKDDVDFERFLELAAAAREMGVETFIFDDGWQARSGDWCPDSPQCPEPRRDADPVTFAPRFPDDRFTAVREVLRGDPADPRDDMRLGLWFTPMSFHPSAESFRTNPQWSCAPVGTATGGVSVIEPNGGSNEAGIGLWNPLALGVDPTDGIAKRAIDYIEGRIRHAITVYGARYFKFDFLVWVDCLGVEPADFYAYHDAFVAMLDRLQAIHPGVTFQVDETNDYRMFPFESVARGPSWFQNGSPRVEQLLHNLWMLAPYVPGFSIGQHAASNDGERAERGVDFLMAAALTQHITFWTRIDRSMSAAERAKIRRWVDFYKRHRSTMATFAYPLLEDPLEKEWTALQPWDPDAGRGWLLAYRLQSPDATRTIALRGVAPGAYRLTAHDPAAGTAVPVGTVSSEDLRAGIPISIPDRYGYAIVRVEPA